MEGLDRSQVQDHDSQAVILSKGQYPGQLGFSVRDPALLLRNSFYALRQDEQTLVDAGRLYQSLFSIFGPPIVFGAGQVNGRSRTDSRLVIGHDGHFDAKDSMGSRRVCIELGFGSDGTLSGHSRLRPTLVADVDRLIFA